MNLQLALRAYILAAICATTKPGDPRWEWADAQLRALVPQINAS